MSVTAGDLHPFNCDLNAYCHPGSQLPPRVFGKQGMRMLRQRQHHPVRLRISSRTPLRQFNRPRPIQAPSLGIHPAGDPMLANSTKTLDLAEDEHGL